MPLNSSFDSNRYTLFSKDITNIVAALHELQTRKIQNSQYVLREFKKISLQSPIGAYTTKYIILSFNYDGQLAVHAINSAKIPEKQLQSFIDKKQSAIVLEYHHVAHEADPELESLISHRLISTTFDQTDIKLIEVMFSNAALIREALDTAAMIDSIDDDMFNDADQQISMSPLLSKTLVNTFGWQNGSDIPFSFNFILTSFLAPTLVNYQNFAAFVPNLSQKVSWHQKINAKLI